jgi:hypothetical protein
VWQCSVLPYARMGCGGIQERSGSGWRECRGAGEWGGCRGGDAVVGGAELRRKRRVVDNCLNSLYTRLIKPSAAYLNRTQEF